METARSPPDCRWESSWVRGSDSLFRAEGGFVSWVGFLVEGGVVGRMQGGSRKRREDGRT